MGCDAASEVVRIFQAVASAMGHMHSMGFIHADMKPNNIIVGSKNGAVKVIDFGQSCSIGTRKARIQGTPDFIAPEQVKLRPLDARTDVEIALLANLITLTPGSVSLDLSEDGRVLYVHAMYIDGGDVEAYRRSVKEGLERRVLELLR